ncbi:low specificity L-threonine aldolase [Planomicrobium sp. CPCC 101079]|uniref:threonine aldolase family protein n=1 Tax=Planomicrobium sp. CPCC 101079 TaxID=2599618 RepID=UPI0011B74272|nr:beta-eliminating lyase-related protein [Planomicrobium sp. CPCC 101079]TWT03730.1 low specificity L-threonine aldolase [Planomicrobium sp. CPCC 101079]
MGDINHLEETFNQTNYQLSGHGKRNATVLKEAFENVDKELESDRYGSGKVIEEFQEKMAALTGKEAAVFFPSGTMAQQIALRIWCDEKALKKVAYHPLSHLEIHEEDGLKELHNIHSILLADKERVINLEDITGLEEEVACLLLELPQREIGGQLPSFDTLERISAYCRDKGIKLHLDGARLLEVLPYYRKTAAEVCALFDSVYISLYKGIGGIAGAILAGEPEFITQAKVWKRRHGGDLISLYPYIVSADYYFEQRADKMKRYYDEAKELAELFNGCHGISTLPKEPVSNMFHVHFQQSKEVVSELLAAVHQQTNIGFASYLKDLEGTACSYEISIGDLYAAVPKEQLKAAFQLLDKEMKQQVGIIRGG